MKAYEVVKAMQEDLENLDELCREILGTLELWAGSGKDTPKQLRSWRLRQQRLAVSIADWNNLSFGDIRDEPSQPRR